MAPNWTNGVAVEWNVSAGTNTSSFSLTPTAKNAAWIEEVPELKESEYFDFW